MIWITKPSVSCPQEMLRLSAFCIAVHHNVFHNVHHNVGEHSPAHEMAARTNHHMRETTAFLKAGKWSFPRRAAVFAQTAATAFTRALSSELDAMCITDEDIRGQFVRAFLALPVIKC